MSITVEPVTIDTPGVTDIVRTHRAYCSDTCPPESCHPLPVDEYADPAVTLWGAMHEGTLVGIGALKALPGGCGEVKSMHTDANRRKLGIGGAILSAIVAEAEAREYCCLCLETGSEAPFAAARALYERRGFSPRGPFGDYREDPLSAFYMKPLGGRPA